MLCPSCGVENREDATFCGECGATLDRLAGDIFLLGSTSWRIRRIEAPGVVRVEDAHGAPPTIPFWLGEAPSRTLEPSKPWARSRRWPSTRNALRKEGRVFHIYGTSTEG